MIKLFAVIKTGGKQYKVQTGDLLRLEKLAAHAGDKVQFNEIMLLGEIKRWLAHHWLVELQFKRM